MQNINLKQGDIIFKSGARVDGFCLLMKGQADQVVGQTRLVHGPGAVLGLSDAFHEVYTGDYTAIEDCTAVQLDYTEFADFVPIFEQMPVYIFGFTKNAVRQCKNIFDIYIDARYLADDFYWVATEKYREYLHMCNEKKMPYKRFTRINYITVPDFKNIVEEWEYEYVLTMNDIPNQQIEQIYGNERAVAIGTIGILCGMMDKALKGLEEISAWLDKNMDIMLADGRMDLFQLWFDMKARACILGRSTADIDERIDFIYDFIQNVNIYPPALVKRKWDAYLGYDFENPGMALGQETGLFINEEISDDIKKEEATFVIENEYEQLIDEEFGDIQLDEAEADDEEGEDCLETIMEFAGLNEQSRIDVKKRIKTYAALPAKDATDDRTRKLRRAIAEDYYKLYEACFFKAIKTPQPNPIIEMFLHFGFMDVTLAGQENTEEIYNLLGRLPLITNDRVFTMYTWLKAIYNMEREPSRNELDLDFKGYVQQEKRAGNIKESQVKAFLESPDERVKFELANFFKSGNRSTSGKMSSFCPPLAKEDFTNTPTSMVLTLNAVNKSLDKVRDIDYSIFCRDVRFADVDKGIKAEDIKKEVLPDIILFPNVGSRGMMWQECQVPKKDTPARFIFPIFSQTELGKLMHYVCGCFRWEICRREMGVRWNDIATGSLTSDFYDYFSFYKKNRELSAEGKEKIKNLLKKNRNSMREAFTSIYITWVNFESSGNVRLNKIEREMLGKYVPFRKPYRQALSGHPMFQDVVSKHEVKCAQKARHLSQLYARYEKNGGKITEELEFNLQFYQM